ncbi:hypothetical protein ASPVEDRAFT_655346 [Aspergillus versicolor CBS 583.65]|uniref:Uncharacterized protein n=1 Tax=Aspergillus versicolor CBS 583.65 TaxID=1036611 RepID=A0A1L9PKU6_ASPVE|nr:uncharacterized protein ASPVEDRAFT_655346 [Aspergillus versicolor CBS 583.65]OJJ02066.1 hypothetical protein ASPVEDRAFT_655346 [Aspergillus versicolor CBS 583.65]
MKLSLLILLHTRQDVLQQVIYKANRDARSLTDHTSYRSLSRSSHYQAIIRYFFNVFTLLYTRSGSSGFRPGTAKQPT